VILQMMMRLRVHSSVYILVLTAVLLSPGCRGGVVLYADEFDKQIKSYEKEMENTKSEISRIEDSIRELEKKKAEIMNKENSIKSGIREIDNLLGSHRSNLKKLNNDYKYTELKIAQAKKLCLYAEEEINCWQKYLSYEWRAAYMWYRTKEGVYPVYDEYLTRVLQQKHSLLQQSLMKKVDADSERRLLEVRKVQLTKRQKEVLSIVGKTSSQKKEREIELAQTATERRKYASEIDKLKKSASDMQKLIDMLETKKHATQEQKQKALLARNEIYKLKGMFDWPVDGKVVSSYGKHKHPEFDTFVINNGIKIMPSVPGCEVRAIANGTVVYTGVFQSYGNIVLLDHGGGCYSLYGTLNKILVQNNQSVTAGSAIGNITGGTLYFEFRANAKPENPLDWLASK